MSNWEQRVRDHQIHGKLMQVESLIEACEQIKDIDSNAVVALYRIRDVARRTGETIAALDPVLIPVSTLNNLSSQFQEVVKEVSSYRANKNAGHLNNANDHIDIILTQLSSLPFQIGNGKTKGFAESLTTFRKTIEKYTKSLEEKFTLIEKQHSQIQTKLQETTNEITNQKSRLDTAISQFQQQFSASEETRRTDFKNTEKERLDEFNEQIQEHEKAFKALLESLQKEHAEITSKVSEQSEKLIEEMQKQKKQAEDLVHVTANVAMAGGYQKEADQARKTKIIWQKVATISIVGLILFAIIAFVTTIGNSDQFDFGKFGARAFVALSFGLLAAYAARQAKDNSDLEKQNRRLHLELASIDPYLSKLPEDKQQEVKIKLADRWFGKQDIAEKAKNDEHFRGSVIETAKMTIQNLLKLVEHLTKTK